MDGKKLLEHLTHHHGKSAEHHTAMVEECAGLRKTFKALAESEDDSNKAAHFQDASDRFASLAGHHSAQARHHLALHSEFAGADAVLFDEHSDGGDIQNVLHAAGFLDQDDLIRKTLVR